MPQFDDNTFQRLALAAQVFNPSAPVHKQSLFAGRTTQLVTTINALSTRGQHVAIYGERGVGKTSLANILSAVFKNLPSSMPFNYVRVNCDGHETFKSLWVKILRELHFVINRPRLGFTDEAQTQQVNLSKYLPQEPTPEDIRYILQMAPSFSIIVIDEMDRVKKREVTALLADTIKTLSDHATHASLVVVGVADSVDQIIEGHRSVERCLVQVHMPRMSKEELFEILNKAYIVLNMKIDPVSKQTIAGLSQGLPHYTHLLGLYATQEAIQEKKEEVTSAHVKVAISKAIAQTQQSLLNAYHQATTSARQTLYKEVLLACALAKTDELGYFAPTNVRDLMSRIMGKSYKHSAFSRHLHDFCDEKRGRVLQKSGSRYKHRYRFNNPLLQPLVVMRGLQDGLVDYSDITT
ncbi:MAG: AAA family ATPase [Ardenticatenaceae bacterium]